MYAKGHRAQWAGHSPHPPDQNSPHPYRFAPGYVFNKQALYHTVNSLKRNNWTARTPMYLATLFIHQRSPGAVGRPFAASPRPKQAISQLFRPQIGHYKQALYPTVNSLQRHKWTARSHIYLPTLCVCQRSPGAVSRPFAASPRPK